jgi:hypothetical protein
VNPLSWNWLLTAFAAPAPAPRAYDEREAQAFADSDPQATIEAQRARYYAQRADTLGMNRGNSEL